jgi:WD40 repeat protein
VGRSVSVRTTYARPLIAFSPDGERVAVEEMPSLEAGASAVRVIDRRSGAETLRLAEHELVGWLDARRLVTVLPGTSELSIRDVETGERSSRRFPRTGSEVFDLSRMLIVQTSGARGEPDIGRAVEVIDGRTGERLAHLHHGSDIAEILWSPDGRWLLLLGSDGALRAWPVMEPAGRPGG